MLKHWLFPKKLRIRKVIAVPGYKIRVTYADGTTGAVDLSDVIGKGVFVPLKDEAFFRKVYIGDHGQIAWSSEIEVCPDTVYRELTDKL